MNEYTAWTLIACTCVVCLLVGMPLVLSAKEILDSLTNLVLAWRKK